MPKLGDTARQVLIVSWHLEVGTKVQEGDRLLTVQTDKIDIEVPSPVSGVLVEQLVSQNDEVAVGEPIVVVEC